MTQVRLFGPVDVLPSRGAPLVVGLRRKSVLAVLALHPGQLVTTDLLAAGVWDEDPPRSALNTLQSHVSYLRRILPPGALTTHGTTGYSLDLPGHATDLQQFTHAVAHARGLHDPAQTCQALDAAVTLASEPALADVREVAYLARHAARIDELVVAARLALARSCLDAAEPGRAADLAAGIVESDPYNEAAHAVHILGLYRQGSQAHALAAHRAVVALLDDELGIEPGPALRSLELALLRQDPSLDLPPGAADARPFGGSRADVGTSSRPARTGQPDSPAIPATGTATGTGTGTGTSTGGSTVVGTGPRPGARPRSRGAAPQPLRTPIGREEDLDALATALSRHRIVSLTGPGGVGKSLLASHLVTTRTEEWGDGGIVWISLGPLAEPDVPRAVVEGAGLLWRDDVDPADAFASAVQEPMLLVLDSAEHVVATVSRLVADLTAATRLLTVLVTTQRRLRVPGEVVHPLEPLCIGPQGEASPDDPAVQLLLERAREANPGLRADADDLPHLYEICRELDGLPLALELAAASLRSMTLAELAEGLDDRFAVLTSGGRTVPARHRTLCSALEWSHRMLSRRERDVLERYAVFRGGGTPAAIRSVCFDDDAGVAEVHNVIGDLVDASLLRHESVRGRSRIGIHSTVHAYAAEQLAARPDADGIRARHAQAVADLVATEAARFHGPHGAEAIEILSDEDGNLTAALTWAAEHDPALAARIGAPLWWYWFRVGRAGAGRALLRSFLGPTGLGDGSPDCLTCAAGMGYLAWVADDYADGTRLADLVLSQSDPAPPDAAVRAFALAVKARTVGERGKLEDAHALARESCELYEATGDVWGAAWSRRCAASVLVLGADPSSAMADLLLARDEFDDVDDAWGAAGTLDVLASTALRVGDAERARSLAAQAAAEYRELGDSSGVRYALQHGAEAARESGDGPAATELATEALSIARLHGYPVGILRALELLADVAEDSQTAQRHLREAARLERRLGAARRSRPMPNRGR